MVELKHTPLAALHEELGARLVPFAGYAMPLQYDSGIINEHLQVRAEAGLFDVSHMGQIAIEGPAAALEALVPGDIEHLAPGRQRYTALTTETGGIIDDLMIAHLPGRFHVVVNAAFKEGDFHLMRAGLADRCTVRMLEDRALLALQGPAAASALEPHCPAAASLAFMDARELGVAGIACIVSRSGYTGEDGFELSVPAGEAERLARLLLADPRVAPIGLGARDSLRLEAGLCLAGTDIDEGTSLVEAGLGWVVARKYRQPGGPVPRFPGAERILAQMREGTRLLRVGMKPKGRIPLRGGTPLAATGGREVGRITSGSFGPSAGHPVAMAYVERELAAPGTELSVSIRGQSHDCEVASLPFVPRRYHVS